MGATFDGAAYFDSGPHRFRMGRAGRIVLAPFQPPNDGSLESLDVAPRELRIVQTGRLAAATAGALWTLWSAIRAKAEADESATLVLPDGQPFVEMRMIRFEALGPIEHGRVASLAYEIEYINLR